jgi:HlyD family secretion protein
MTAQVHSFRPARKQDNTTGRELLPRGYPPLGYILPAFLCLGFLALTSWAAVGFLFPSRLITAVSPDTPQSKVTRAGSPLFEAAGWIEPCPTAIRVTALAAGVVDKLLVVEDQPVTAGEAVAELVKDDARHIVELALLDLKLRKAELEEARAVLTAATTRLEQPVHLELPLTQTEAAVAKIETQLETIPFEIRGAEARLDFANQDYQRKSALKGVVAGRTIDQTRSAFEEATASLEELQARRASLGKEREALCGYRDSLKVQLQLKVEEIQAKREAEAKFKAAEVRVKQAETFLAEARLRLDRMTVRAPMDGRILGPVALPGTKLTDGMGHGDTYEDCTVVTMYLPDNLQVQVDVCFEDTAKVSLGQPVRIECPAVPEPLDGRVSFVGSTVDARRNTLPVKVVIDSPPSGIRPRMLVDVAFLPPSRPGDE